jgi:hypothetical protein
MHYPLARAAPLTKYFVARTIQWRRTSGRSEGATAEKAVPFPTAAIGLGLSTALLTSPCPPLVPPRANALPRGSTGSGESHEF